MIEANEQKIPGNNRNQRAEKIPQMIEASQRKIPRMSQAD
jgi:hypothetical protein